MPCHHIIVGSITITPIPAVVKKQVWLLSGDKVSDCASPLSQIHVICTWRTRRSIRQCVQNAEFLFCTILSKGNGKFYTVMMYLRLNRLVCISIGSPSWWWFSFCLSGSSPVFSCPYSQLLGEFWMWSHRYKELGSQWFQGRTGVSEEYVQPYRKACHDIFSHTNPRESTVCVTKMSRGMPWIDML